MAISTTQIKTWGIVQWQAQVKHVAPSEGGAVGVMFCWCRNPASDGPDYSRVGTADFVVKPSPGSAATTKFAEKLMNKTLGAANVNTLPILRADPRFQAILAALGRSKQGVDNELSRNMGPASKALYDLQARWNSVWPHYQSAASLLVQELAVGMAEFDKVMHDPRKGLGALLGNRQLMVNLGKLFAVDAVLGNGDRLCSLNGGNILFKETSAQIYSVDSQAILVSYQGLLALGAITVKEWVQQILDTNAGVQLAEAPLQVQAPAFSMEKLYDVDHWWRSMFRGHLQNSMQRHGETPPGEAVWHFALIWFKQGVEEGLRAVDSQLSGLNWLGVKSKFKSYEKRYGASGNLDWTNFKIRRMYVRMVIADRNKPGTAAQKQQRALDRVVAYAARKVGASAIM